jgi:hypothetical protein
VTILLFMGLDTKECNFIVQTASKTDYEESWVIYLILCHHQCSTHKEGGKELFYICLQLWGGDLRRGKWNTNTSNNKVLYWCWTVSPKFSW